MFYIWLCLLEFNWILKKGFWVTKIEIFITTRKIKETKLNHRGQSDRCNVIYLSPEWRLWWRRPVCYQWQMDLWVEQPALVQVTGHRLSAGEPQRGPALQGRRASENHHQQWECPDRPQWARGLLFAQREQRGQWAQGPQHGGFWLLQPDLLGFRRHARLDFPHDASHPQRNCPLRLTAWQAWQDKPHPCQRLPEAHGDAALPGDSGKWP